MSGKIFVVPRGDSWAIRREGEQTDASSYGDRSEALAAGQGMSERDNCELVVHDVERRSRPRG